MTLTRKYWATCGLLLLAATSGFAAVYAARMSTVSPIVLSHTHIDLGHVPVGAEVRKSITVRNRSWRPVRIAHVNVSCSCVRVDGLPETLAAFEERRFQVFLRPYVPGAFSQRFGVVTAGRESVLTLTGDAFQAGVTKKGLML